MAVDFCLAQLPAILAGTVCQKILFSFIAVMPLCVVRQAEFQHCPFFSDQLMAFEVWLDMGAGSGGKEAPEQLPVVLQVCKLRYYKILF
jgi:hypothetical protein